MNVSDTVYAIALVVGNLTTAGVMYALGNPVFTAMLAAVGLIVLGATVFARPETPRPEATRPDPDNRV